MFIHVFAMKLLKKVLSSIIKRSKEVLSSIFEKKYLPEFLKCVIIHMLNCTYDDF